MSGEEIDFEAVSFGDAKGLEPIEERVSRLTAHFSEPNQENEAHEPVPQTKFSVSVESVRKQHISISDAPAYERRYSTNFEEQVEQEIPEKRSSHEHERRKVTLSDASEIKNKRESVEDDDKPRESSALEEWVRKKLSISPEPRQMSPGDEPITDSQSTLESRVSIPAAQRPRQSRMGKEMFERRKSRDRRHSTFASIDVQGEGAPRQRRESHFRKASREFEDEEGAPRQRRESHFRKASREFEDEEGDHFQQQPSVIDTLPNKYSKDVDEMLIGRMMRGSRRYSRAPDVFERRKSRGPEQANLDEIKHSQMFQRLSVYARDADELPHGTRFSGLVEEMEKKLKTLEVDRDKGYSITQKESDKKLRFGDEQVNATESGHASKGMRFEYGECPKTCERFLKIEDFTQLFVDKIAEDALLKGKGFRQQSAIRIIEGFEYTEESDSLSVASIGTYVCVFEWPTIEQFTVEIGTIKLEEYLSYWKFEEAWKYCIHFLGGDSDSACDFYRYEAIFSIPCKQYPIPQATASVYFTFELSRVRPIHCLVDVYYCFEGQRLMHTPGKFTFQEERLFNIIDAKINFYKTLTF